MEMKSRIRCFIAIDVEDPLIVNKIRDFQRELSSVGARLKLVEPWNLHFTLRFIGEVPLTIVNSIKNELEKIVYNPFEVELCGVGAFPTISRPRVVWIGVGAGSREMEELARIIDQSLLRAKLPRRRENFVPHLTVARVKASARSLSGVLKRLRNLEFGKMEVKNIRLKKSTLTLRGPIYETLLEKKLIRTN